MRRRRDRPIKCRDTQHRRKRLHIEPDHRRTRVLLTIDGHTLDLEPLQVGELRGKLRDAVYELGPDEDRIRRSGPPVSG